jgi:hypothetical protein
MAELNHEKKKASKGIINPGGNLMIVRYNASAVKSYNASDVKYYISAIKILQCNKQPT